MTYREIQDLMKKLKGLDIGTITFIPNSGNEGKEWCCHICQQFSFNEHKGYSPNILGALEVAIGEMCPTQEEKHG